MPTLGSKIKPPVATRANPQMNPVYKSTCFPTCGWACPSYESTPCTTESRVTKQRHWVSHTGVCVCMCVFFLFFFRVCECSHPFTTITQTSQASGSVPKPIRPDDKRCLHSDGYFQTDKLAVKFDLRSTTSRVCDWGAGRPEGPPPPPPPPR